MLSSGDMEADVVIVGAGPAGCSLALNLAPFKRVLLLDKGSPASRRVGESLPAAGLRLLRDMDLEQAFLAQRHAPCHVTYSCWGADALIEQDALRNLDGPGWHLDRDRFDAWLAGVAVTRGAARLAETRLTGLERTTATGPGWVLGVERRGKPLQIQTTLVVDASGRDTVLARYLGAKRQVRGKLVCGWMFGHDPGESTGVSEIHAEQEGWWYTASLPGQRRLLAFYTDADLLAARSAHTRQGLLARLESMPELQRQLTGVRFQQNSKGGFCAAHGQALEQPWGEGWLAIGDAALAFDPLSSQGLLNGLYTGLMGAEAVYCHLQGDAGALAAYGREIGQLDSAYLAHLDAWYGLEMRWPDSSFWKRRHGRASRTTGPVLHFPAAQSSQP